MTYDGSDAMGGGELGGDDGGGGWVGGDDGLDEGLDEGPLLEEVLVKQPLLRIMLLVVVNLHSFISLPLFHFFGRHCLLTDEPKQRSKDFKQLFYYNIK